MRLLALPLLVLCTLLDPRQARAETHVVETEHYRLHLEGERALAEEYARVLEAAWKGFEAHFGAAPKLKEGERLVVRFFHDREGWVAGIQADGTAAPTTAGGYYWPGSQTAYLYRQPTSYFTRVLLVHEAAHQFHYLARTDNKAPSAAWYTEGVAEHLSWHAWDGEHLTLGVVPQISLKDHPAVALAAVKEADFDLEALVEARTEPSRALCWALYRYLATGRDGRPLRGFEVFTRKMDAGGAVGPACRRAFGPPDRLLKRLRAWLEDAQQPFVQVFNEWEGVGERALRGHAGVVSFCRLKAEADEISAFLRVPAEGAWSGGLVLHFTGPEDYTVLLVAADGSLRVDRRANGAWQRLARLEGPRPEPGALLPLRAWRRGEDVFFAVGGREHGPYSLPGRAFGLAVDASDLRFSDVSWR